MNNAKSQLLIWHCWLVALYWRCNHKSITNAMLAVVKKQRLTSYFQRLFYKFFHPLLAERFFIYSIFTVHDIDFTIAC